MKELHFIEKSSRRSTILSLTGFLIFLLSLLFASYNLYKTEHDYDADQKKLIDANKTLAIEKKKVDGLKHDEADMNEYLINLLNSTQANQGNPHKAGPVNWDTIKKAVVGLPSGKRKLAITIALLTTWKEIPFKFGAGSQKSGFDSSHFLEYIMGQVGIKFNLDNIPPQERLSTVIMNSLKKVDHPLPGDLIFFKEVDKGVTDNFGLIYLCAGNKNGKGIGIGTLDESDSLNIYDTYYATQPSAFVGYYRVNY